MLLTRFLCNSNLIKNVISKRNSELQHKLFCELSFVANFCVTVIFISDASVLKIFASKKMS